MTEAEKKENEERLRSFYSGLAGDFSSITKPKDDGLQARADELNRQYKDPTELMESGVANSQLTMDQILELGPQLSQQQWDAIKEFLPQQTQLAMDLRRQFEPQNMALDLELAQQFQPQFQSLQEGLRSSDINAQFGDISRLTPQLDEIRRAAEGKDVSAMRDLLGQQILGDLQFGGNLTDEQRRATEQSQRSGELSRGIAGGSGSANRESVAKALEGMKLQRDRQQAASGFMSQESQQRFDPFLAIGGRPATAQASAAGFLSNLGQQPNTVGQLSDPTSTAFGVSQFGQNLARQDDATALERQKLSAALGIAAPQAGINPSTFNFLGY